MNRLTLKVVNLYRDKNLALEYDYFFLFIIISQFKNLIGCCWRVLAILFVNE